MLKQQHQEHSLTRARLWHNRETVFRICTSLRGLEKAVCTSHIKGQQCHHTRQSQRCRTLGSSEAGRGSPTQGILSPWQGRAPYGHFPELHQEEATCFNFFLRYRYLQHYLMKNTVTKTWWFLPLPNLKMRAEKTFCLTPKPKSVGKNLSGPTGGSEPHLLSDFLQTPHLPLTLGLHTVLPLDSWLPEK